MGFGLFQILSLDMSPGQDDWETHKQWWDTNYEKLQLKLNKRGVYDEYHEFVAWRSQLFMNKYWELVAKVNELTLFFEKGKKLKEVSFLKNHNLLEQKIHKTKSKKGNLFEIKQFPYND